MKSKYLVPTYSFMDKHFLRGEDVYLIDENNNKYLDLACGISVTNFGHSHPYLLGLLVKQGAALWHTSNIFFNPIIEKLATRLVQKTFPGQVFFSNSGAEANEAAIKLAMIHNNINHKGSRPKIITLKEGFHGRTYATLSATGQNKIQEGFEPILDRFIYADLNNISQVEKLFARGDISAIIVEVIQGESGVRVGKKDYFNAIREISHKHDALMIVDEVQSGFGRTGKLFGYQNFDFIPDAITMAKAMANGIPMGGIIVSSKYSALFGVGKHGSTFGGNLLAASVSHGVLDLLTDELLAEISIKGDKVKKHFNSIVHKEGVEMFGMGLMLAVSFPEKIENTEIIKKGMDNGLVLIKGGNNTIRFYPPLIITENEIIRAATLLAKIINE